MLVSGGADARIRLWEVSTGKKLFDLLGMIFVVTFIGGVLRALRRSAALTYEKAAFIITVVITILLTSTQWDGHLGYFRAAIEVSLLGGLVLLNSAEEFAPALLAGSVGMWAATAGVDAIVL